MSGNVVHDLKFTKNQQKVRKGRKEGSKLANKLASCILAQKIEPTRREGPITF